MHRFDIVDAVNNLRLTRSTSHQKQAGESEPKAAQAEGCAEGTGDRQQETVGHGKQYGGNEKGQTQ